MRLYFDDIYRDVTPINSSDPQNETKEKPSKGKTAITTNVLQKKT